MGVVNPAVFLTQRSRGAERQRIPGTLRANWERVAARGFARARRAAGGFACKPASAIGPPQRCVASPPPDLETRFAGHGSPTGKGLREVVSSGFKTPWGFSKNFLSRRNGGLPNPARRGKPRRGRGKAMAADGELVHQAADWAVPQAVADGSSPSRFPKFARSAQPRTLCFSASPPLCVRGQPRTCALARKCASMQMCKRSISSSQRQCPLRP